MTNFYSCQNAKMLYFLLYKFGSGFSFSFFLTNLVNVNQPKHFELDKIISNLIVLVFVGINFSVNPMHLESGELMFCLWVSQDLDKSSINSFSMDFPSTSNEDSTSITDTQVSTVWGKNKT